MIQGNVKINKGVQILKIWGKQLQLQQASNKIFLMKRLFNMKMSEGGSVAEHLNEFNILTSQLSSTKVNFDNEVRALVIVCSFLESQNVFVMVVSKYVPCSNTFKFDGVVSVIICKEM